MGNETSTAEDTDTSSLHQQSPNERKEIAFDETASAFSGFRVLGIQEQSPACNVGFVSFFDFILSANGIRLDTKDSTFMELIAQSEEKPLQLDVYNIKSQTIRQLEITPSRQWSGKGLLGVTIRFDSYEHADDQLLHVLHVVKRSPAFKAGLRAKSDYLLGTPDSVFRDTEDLQTEILQSLEVALPFQCYVYNTEEDQVRIVSILPTEQWGGNGLLGAEVAHGVLHRLPSACRKTIGVSVGFVSLATEITAATDAYMLEQVPAHTPVIQDTSVPSGEAPIMSPSDPLALQPISEEETQEPGNDTYQPEEFSTHASIPSAPVQSSIPANSSDESSNKPRYAPQLDPMFPMSTVEVLADTIIK